MPVEGRGGEQKTDTGRCQTRNCSQLAELLDDWPADRLIEACEYWGGSY